NEMTFSKRKNRYLWIGAGLLLGALVGWAQSPAPAAAQATPAAAQAAPPPAQAAPPPAAPAPAAGAPAMDVPLDVKAAKPPAPEDLAKGDPGGTITGTATDVVVA